MKHIQTFEGFLNEAALNEYTDHAFKPRVLDRGNTLDPKFFAKLMPRTAKTTDEAMERIWMFERGTMFVHVQYFEVKPNGNKPDRPTYRLHQNQYWLSSAYDNQIKNLGLDPKQGVNTTLLTVIDITDGQDKNLGSIWVDTKEFLDECNRVFEMLKKA